ncbi:YfbU family protein [Pseudomonas aeruginosa]|uniref:YfbU family protein n=1 Tax=Pseudomonas aeruginosa TaxID=287 RepID=UPI0009A40640|nr:YfbU family protein [Pseudomonas aeruginosa]MCT5658158.1 YfbU family protein [Pseudomonas aeruginosa]MDI2218387.1 YfbU family protein [Pseudomonas aeruginosa]MDP5715783.1 YfbU family protein [Pseudomonas aeruginosa]MDS4330786.1 YfbU family protein [Pseudomonas aeruginosa]MDU0785501.1 YfbU family protein [Pseudomonas aeruginosa]
MDKLQLLILKNQYEILCRLKEGDREYQAAWKAIDQGYEYEIEALIDEAVRDPVSMGDCKEVREILDMYRKLQTSLQKADVAAELSEKVSFPGFDGNEETLHYSYACYLLQDKGLWFGLKGWEEGTWNSHCPMLPRYRSMLKVFREAPGYPYPVEFVERVIVAGDERY